MCSAVVLKIGHGLAEGLDNGEVEGLRQMRRVRSSDIGHGEFQFWGSKTSDMGDLVKVTGPSSDLETR